MILKNAIMGWSAKAVNFAAAIIATPIFISYLGQASYGVWLLLMNIWVLMALFDMGVFLAFVRFIADDFSADDRQSALATTANSLSLYSLLGLLVLALYFVLILTVDRLLNIPPELHEAARWALVPLGVTSALGLPSRTFEGILFAREKIYMLNWVRIAAAVLRVLLIVAFLDQGWGLMGIALGHSAATLVEYMTINWFGWREMPYKGWLRLGWDRPLMRRLVSYAGDIMFAVAAGKARLQAPSLMLGALSSAVAVAIFGVGLRLLNQAMDLVSAVVTSAQPRFSSLESAHDYDAWRAIFMRTSFYTSYIAGYLCLGILLLAKPFIHVWLGPDFAVSAEVAMILAIPFGLYMALYPCEAVLVSLRTQRSLGWLCLGELAVLLLTGWLSFSRWGALGAAWSLAASLVILRPWWLSFYVCRRLDMSWSGFWLGTVGRSWLSQALAGLPLFFLLKDWPSQSWPLFLAAGLLLSLASGLSFWLVGLDCEERAFWLGKLRRKRATD
jgi:O-antigen/teichoic acid export membrane protein